MDKCRLHEIRKLIRAIYCTDELFYLVARNFVRSRYDSFFRYYYLLIRGRNLSILKIYNDTQVNRARYFFRFTGFYK